MGAIKPREYSHHEIQLLLINRALAHPMRIQIMKMLNESNCLRLTDLSLITHTALSTVKDHLEKLHEGKLICFKYHSNSYAIFPNPEYESLVKSIINFQPESETQCAPFTSKMYF